MKKKFLATILLSLAICFVANAQELHDAKVNGIVRVGNNFIASITDLTTNNVYKTTLFEKGLLVSNEGVLIDFSNDPTLITGKIVKTGLNVTIFAFLSTNYIMSIEEFKANATSQGEIDFFKQNPLTDNTEFASKVYNINEETVIIKPEETMKVLPGRNWFWTDCKYAYGVCATVVDPAGEDLIYRYSTENKVLLSLPLVENGLTSDGYLPIGDDVFVKKGLIMKKGIYKASFSEKKKGYTVVAIDIIGE
ncbi:MAG: hypothetical protein H6587_03540 [Flavobacteriales bacterium]|nr:hypothetical protein [Flavobacteriales bacterium]MCB9363622.1 hypothetical protein [Flavobacteriales bacterium]